MNHFSVTAKIFGSPTGLPDLVFILLNGGQSGTGARELVKLPSWQVVCSINSCGRFPLGLGRADGWVVSWSVGGDLWSQNSD